MRYPKIKGFCLALCGGLAAHTGVFGDADAAQTATRTSGQDRAGWAWRAAPDPEAGENRQEAWKEKDGSFADYLMLAGGETHVVSEQEPDLKAIVLSGSVSASGTSIARGGYFTLPAAAPREISCDPGASCRVFLEFEPTRGKIAQVSFGAADIPFVEVPGTYGNVSLAWVWGTRDSAAPSSFFLKFKPGFPGFPHLHSHSYRGLVIEGAYKHWAVGEADVPVLPAGAHFRQEGKVAHDDACDPGSGCLAYFRIENSFDIAPAE